MRYTTNSEACFVVIDCYWKSTNASANDVSVWFYLNGGAGFQGVKK